MLLRKCAAMSETSFIIKEWKNAQTAQDFFSIITQQLPWCNTTNFHGIIPCFFLCVPTEYFRVVLTF